MFRRKGHKEVSGVRQWSLIVLTLSILFSSCTTKRSIKTLLEIPVSTAQPIKDLKNKGLRNLLDYCSVDEELSFLITSSGEDPSSDNLVPYSMRSGANSYIAKHVQVKINPNYYTPHISGEIPTYILLQKLVLYNL